jgi:hypothetical protein
MDKEYDSDIIKLQKDLRYSLETPKPLIENAAITDMEYENLSGHGYRPLNHHGIIECESISSGDLTFDPEDDLDESPDFNYQKDIPEQVPAVKQEIESQPSSPNTADINENRSVSTFIETFESVDGNAIDAGHFVTLDGVKVKKVGLWDNYILGVTSKNSDCEQKSPLTPVILSGKAIVQDDGTCVPNGFCIPNSTGIATAWYSGYRVMERKGPKEILILIK